MSGLRLTVRRNRRVLVDVGLALVLLCGPALLPLVPPLSVACVALAGAACILVGSV